MFSIPGLQQIVDYTKGKVKLTLIFEVVDDPEDTQETRDITKPLNIRFAFDKKGLSPTLDDFRKGTGITILPGLTKQTPREARQFSFTTLEKDVSLHVLAEPAPEWSSRYGPRIYKIQVDAGRIYNIPVSIEPKVRSAPTSEDTATSVPSGKRKGLNL